MENQEKDINNFLFDMIFFAKDNKYLYEEIIYGLIDYVEHIKYKKCPIDKKEMVERFLKFWNDLHEK